MSEKKTGVENQDNMNDYQRAYLKVERFKALLTASSVIATLLVALVAYYSSHQAQNRHSINSFKLKVAEIVFSARNGYEAKQRLEAMQSLFPDSVWDELKEFNPDKTNWSRTSHTELMSYIATNPKCGQLILDSYLAVFPNDSWADNIKLPESKCGAK